MHDIVDHLRTLSGSPTVVREIPNHPPFQLSCSVDPPLKFDPGEIERNLGERLHPDLLLLWKLTSRLRLYEDTYYGQCGLVTWTPNEMTSQNQRAREILQSDCKSGDVFFGAFRGESDLLIVRCDREQHDYGSIVIAGSIDPRGYWRTAARNLTEFLESFVAAKGEFFWEKR